MESVLLVIHLFLALAIIGLVLLQRSEGGGLGIGGGSGGLGGLASPESTTSLLTRATAFCAAAFFCTSLALGILAGQGSKPSGLMDALENTTPSVSIEEPAVPVADDMPVSAPVVPVVPAETQAAPEVPMAVPVTE